jgi:hypothetical protein
LGALLVISGTALLVHALLIWSKDGVRHAERR